MERQLEFEDEGRNPGYERYIRQNRFPLYLVLDNITDPRNLGSLFRLADAARLSGLFLLSETRLELPPSAKRASRSTWKQVPFEHFTELDALQKRLGQLTWIALEKTDQSQVYWNRLPPAPTALVLGNEAEGVRQELLDQCHYSIHLPMLGWNTSMNVAMAAGIAVYEWLRTFPKEG